MTTFILPGMGATSEMYDKKYYGHLKDVKFINWPEYKNKTTIDIVANNLIKLYNINSDSIVGGSSLGGVIALEIAKIVKAQKVLLIGSANNPEMINPFLKKLSNLSDYAPIKLIQLFTEKLNFISKNDILKMFTTINPEFIKSMCKALANWQNLNKFDGEIIQIHGQNDHIIKPPLNNSIIIPHGGHLIAITHPKEVSNFIEENI